MSVLVIELKGMKWGNANRKSRDVEQGEGTLKGGCFSDRNKTDEVGKKQQGKQGCGTGGGDIKVGILVIGIKGTKWRKGNREGGDVAQGERTLR